eukprot:TRINITY_DN1517_c1_g2_i1.p1 TRINITY_DN1517_c1_g2~~TRINITY_DN1517_c1_g2_i1.p1  ORF type:complete len:609 (+),score=210.39 TRINITY_DN1517_c1_g2_i1:83-1909(+)
MSTTPTKRSYSAFSFDYVHRSPPSPTKVADRYFMSRSSSTSLSDHFYFSTLSSHPLSSCPSSTQNPNSNPNSSSFSSSTSNSSQITSSSSHLPSSSSSPSNPPPHPSNFPSPSCIPSNNYSSFLPCPSPSFLPSSSSSSNPSPYTQSILSELVPNLSTSPFLPPPLPLYPSSPSFLSSPLSPSTSPHLLKTISRIPRKISLSPIRILEAPLIKDDFYLNLVEWSSTNILAVALANSVYLYHPSSSIVSLLLTLPSNSNGSERLLATPQDLDTNGDDSITGVCWMPNGENLAVGTSKGRIEIWNVEKKIKLHSYISHRGRVGAMCWNEFWGNGNLLTSGSRDRTIIHRDIRINNTNNTSSNNNNNSGSGSSSRSAGIGVYNAHKQEVCGLKWSTFDGFYLASGGNDNKLFLWDIRSSSSNANSTSSPSSTSSSSLVSRNNNVKPLFQFEDHTAAVKAIAWSPHKRHILASGGGTADRKIRFWKGSTGEPGKTVDTGSQVCNLAWSKNVNELVSTHGYSQHQIVVWSVPGMEPLATLTGHCTRVLYLSVSPEGSTIVTGAGDETLRFWKVFPGQEEMAEMKRKRSRRSGGGGGENGGRREFGKERSGGIR